MGLWPKPQNKASDQLSETGLAAVGELAAFLPTLRRSSFKQPAFLREAWTSEQARALHKPRMDAIRWAWKDIEWRSAGALRPCALLVMSEHALLGLESSFRQQGLSIEVLRLETRSLDGRAAGDRTAHVAVGARRDVARLRKAWIEPSGDTIGALLGYPPCCRAFFEEAFTRNRIVDPGWLIARFTPEAEVRGLAVSVAGFAQANILLRRLGVRAVPHFPCSYGCVATRELGRALLALGRELGHDDACNDLIAMLDWPVSWSARHGIAEVRTPVLKFATQTDATPDALTIEWRGGTLPDARANGLCFPYGP